MRPMKPKVELLLVEIEATGDCENSIATRFLFQVTIDGKNYQTCVDLCNIEQQSDEYISVAFDSVNDQWATWAEEQGVEIELW